RWMRPNRALRSSPVASIGCVGDKGLLPLGHRDVTSGPRQARTSNQRKILLLEFRYGETDARIGGQRAAVGAAAGPAPGATPVRGGRDAGRRPVHSAPPAEHAARAGFAVQDSRNGPYRPGPVLEEIGLAAVHRFDVRQVARPVLERLWTQTGETVSLGVLEGREIRFVDGIEGTRTVRVGNRTGVCIPAHCTAAGKAIMAVLPRAEFQRRFAGRSLERRTEASVSSWPELTRELAAIRRAGFAMNVEEGEPGVCAVGAAVRDATGVPVASVNVVLPSSRMPTKRVGRSLAGMVVAAAGAVSEALRSGG